MISDKCKQRCCVYLKYTNHGCHCAKRNHGLDYEDDEDINCQDECFEHEVDDDD